MNRTPNPTTRITPHELLTGEIPPPIFKGIPKHITPLGRAVLNKKRLAYERLLNRANKRKLRKRDIAENGIRRSVILY